MDGACSTSVLSKTRAYKERNLTLLWAERRRGYDQFQPPNLSVGDEVVRGFQLLRLTPVPHRDFAVPPLSLPSTLSNSSSSHPHRGPIRCAFTVAKKSPTDQHGYRLAFNGLLPGPI
jgi:hypothetical protein